MGISAQQYRAVSGCFTARMWSSDWTPGSSGGMRSNWRWYRRRTGRARCTSSTVCWGSWLLLLANIVISAIPMTLGPAVVISVAEDIVNGEAVTNLREWGDLSVFAGYSVTSSAVKYSYNSSQLLLLLSGDVETNPGPPTVEVTTQESYEQSLV